MIESKICCNSLTHDNITLVERLDVREQATNNNEIAELFCGRLVFAAELNKPRKKVPAPRMSCQSFSAHSLGLFFVAVERREFDQKNIHKNKN